MKESIYTIPLTEVFEPKDGCPLCRLENTLVERTVEYIIGAAMMEPDVRTETNRKGFCKLHLEMMLPRKRKLAMALMLDTRMQELLDEFVKPENFDKNGSKYAPSPSESCYVCAQVEEVMKKMVDNVISRYNSDSEFQKLYKDQPCYCLKHFETLGLRAYPVLGRKKAPEFLTVTAEITRRNLTDLQKDLKEMQLAFDYRNAGKQVSEQAKNAVERTVEFLG